MHHWYLRLLTSLMRTYKRRMARMRGPYSPYLDVLVFISFFQCLNLYAFFTHVLFPDTRHCAACQADVRIAYAGLAWIGFVGLNALLLLSETPIEPLGKLRETSYYKYLKVYLVLSVVLALF